MGKTTTLHVHHGFLYISLPSLHDYDVKMHNFTFVENVNTRQQLYFSFPEPPEKITNSWQIERDGISAIKFEAARLHFSSDVFEAVAVVVTWAPYCSLKFPIKYPVYSA